MACYIIGIFKDGKPIDVRQTRVPSIHYPRLLSEFPNCDYLLLEEFPGQGNARCSVWKRYFGLMKSEKNIKKPCEPALTPIQNLKSLKSPVPKSSPEIRDDAGRTNGFVDWEYDIVLGWVPKLINNSETYYYSLRNK